MEYQDNNTEDLLEKIKTLQSDLDSLKLAYSEAIADRKSAEEALLKTNIFLESAIELSPNALWISDENGTLIRINQACRDNLHLKDEEVVGKYNLFNDNLIEEKGLMPRIHDVFTKGITTSFEISYDTGAVFGLDLGSTVKVVLKVSVSPILNSQGKVTNAVIQHTDITKLKKAEEVSRDSQQVLETIINSIPVRVFWKDRNLTYLGCNTAFAMDAGLTNPKEIIGKNDFQLAWSNLATDYRQDDMEVIESGVARYNIEETVTTLSGDTINVLTSKMPLRDPNGEVSGVLGIFMDFTERKKAEDALLESEEKLRGVLENSIDASYKRNLLTNTYDYLSPVFTSISGYSPEDMRTLPLDITVNLIHPDDRPDIESTISRAFADSGGLHYDLHYRFRHKSGHHIWLHDKFTVLRDSKNTPVALVGSVSDITERKIAQAKEHFKNVLLTTVQETSLDGILVVDENGNMISWNHKFTDLWRFPEDLIKEDKSSAMHQYAINQIADPVSYLETIRNLYENKRNTSRDELLLKDGRIFSRYSAPMFSAEEKFLGRVWYFRDITESKMARKQLELMKHSIDVHNDGYYWMDINNKFFYVNESGCKALGYTLEELVGKPLNMVNPEATEEVMKYVWEILRKDGFISTEATHIGKDGIRHPVEITSSYVVFEGVEYNCGFARDISERKQAEEALRKSEERMRDLTFSLGDWIWEVDEKGVYTYSSQKGFDYFGSAHESIIGKTPFDFMLPCDAGNKAEVFAEIIKTQTPMKDLENWVETASGEKICLLTNGVPVFDKDMNLIGYRGVDKDITQRKRMEEELIKAKEKAEESDRLKSAFLANMSHEIRTPMNGILGFAELLKEPELTGEEQLNYIRIIEKSGARMLNIINDIISISKIESGQMESFISTTNINDLLAYHLNFFHPEAAQKGNKLTCTHWLSEQNKIIQTDSEKVYAILTNLIKNAVKFTKQGSIEFGCEQKTNFLEFFVKDTGTGISREKQEVIFERFIQGSSFLTRNYEGAGLGLSISKAYVKMLGGEIWVQSKEGVGSTFYFTIANPKE